MDKERLQYIDNLKAFAIILVVVGHVIQYFLCPDDYSQNVVFKYIYAFHMQLFIFLSGVTFSNRITDKVELYHKLGRRAKQLLLPFISWTVIGSLMTHNPYSVLTNILHPGYGLWFIWDLFFIYAYMSIAIHIGRKSKLRMGGGIIIAFIIAFLIGVLANNLFDSKRIARLMIFFALGYYCKPLFKKNAFSLCIMIISLLIYSVGTYFWKSTPLISDIAMSDIITQILSSTPFRFLLAVSGCFGVSLLFYYMSFVVKTFYFQKFGQITLGIYVIHFTLLKLKSFVPSISYSIYSITLLTMALIFVSIVIYCLLRKNKYTSLILLGK